MIEGTQDPPFYHTLGKPLKVQFNKLVFHSLKLEFSYTKLLLYKYQFILSLFPWRVDDILNRRSKKLLFWFKKTATSTPTTHPPIPTHIPITEIKNLNNPPSQNRLGLLPLSACGSLTKTTHCPSKALAI